MPPGTCPQCKVPRQSGPECPRCGVLYAKAEARQRLEKETLRGAAQAADIRSPELTALWPETPAFNPAAEEASLERSFRRWALPAALAGMALCTAEPMLRALIRIFLSMWVHEFGHAVAAWMSGLFALPGPWFTSIAERRTMGPGLFFFGLTAFTGWSGWRRRSVPLLFGAGVALAGQLWCTFVLGQSAAHAFVTFMGDGGCFVLGTLLMAAFYVGPEHPLRKGQVRWGLLLIGAAAYVDAFRTWWAARRDVDAIPFGTQERAGLSDPSRLVEQYGWSIPALVRTYLGLAGLCALVVLGVYLWGLRRATDDGTQAH